MTNIILTNYELFFSRSGLCFGEVDMIKLRIILSSVSHFLSPKHLKLVFYSLGEVKGTLDKQILQKQHLRSECQKNKQCLKLCM